LLIVSEYSETKKMKKQNENKAKAPEAAVSAKNSGGGDDQLVTLKVDDILPNPNQARKDFSDKEALQELADSIKASGLSQYPTVRMHPTQVGKYQIISGERRWRAFKLAGLAEIPVIIKGDVKDNLSAEIQSLNENLHRSDLSPVEEEDKIYDLHVKYKLSERDIAELTGRGQKTINHILQAKRFRDKLPSRIRLTTSKTALWKTEFIKDESTRIKILELIQDKKIKLQRDAIRDAYRVLAMLKGGGGPAGLEEAYFSGLLPSLDWIENHVLKVYRSTKGRIFPGQVFSSEIPIDLKKELIEGLDNTLYDRKSFNDTLNELIASHPEQEPEEIMKGVKPQIDDFELEIKERVDRTMEKLKSKYGNEFTGDWRDWRLVNWWISEEAAEKTQHLKDNINLRIAVFDRLMECEFWKMWHKGILPEWDSVRKEWKKKDELEEDGEERQEPNGTTY
jgi:ParB/RepB/Spo0J family partition protein